VAHTLAPFERYDERLAAWIDETTNAPAEAGAFTSVQMEVD
jgi:hypothetical protein